MTAASLIEVPVTWLSGKTARAEPVRMVVVHETVRIFARPDTNNALETGHTATPSLLATAPVSALHISTRMGSVPYRITFPDGGVAVANDHASVENALKVPTAQGWLPKLEANPVAVVVAIVALLATVGFAFHTLIPAVAEFAATRIPRSAEQKLGEAALNGLDRFLLKKSYTGDVLRKQYQVTFDKLAKAAGLENEVNLQFRYFSPNALALPGGTIILTDRLLDLMKGEERLIAAVIAHELGHIHHRHSLRQILQGSASALLVSVVAGDVSGMSGLITTAPVVLSSLKYTRDGEREADQFAFDLLRKTGYSPNDFADAMARFALMGQCMALRNSDRQKAKAEALPREQWPYQIEIDESDIEPPTSEQEASARRPLPLINPSICYTEPEAYIEGREAELQDLKRVGGRRTGYLHTHPETEERIAAARAAAKR